VSSGLNVVAAAYPRRADPKNPGERNARPHARLAKKSPTPIELPSIAGKKRELKPIAVYAL